MIPKDCNPPDSSVHGILQARILEWVVITFFRRPSKPRDQTWVFFTAGGLLIHWAMREAQDLWGYPQFFSFFFLYSTLQQLLPLFHLTDHLSIFCLSYCTNGSFLSIFNFSNCVIHLCFFFTSLMSLLIVLIAFIFTPFYFRGFGTSSLSLFWILFQVVSLFLLCLFDLVHFDFVYSFVLYFCLFIFSPQLTPFEISFSQALGSYSFLLLVLLSVVKVGSVVCVDFLLGVTCACTVVRGGELGGFCCCCLSFFSFW